MTDEFRREVLSSTKKNTDSLEHSAEGTTWSKKYHKYTEKHRSHKTGKMVYTYYTLEKVGPNTYRRDNVVSDTEDYDNTIINPQIPDPENVFVELDTNDNTKTAKQFEKTLKYYNAGIVYYDRLGSKKSHGIKTMSPTAVTLNAYKNRAKKWLKGLKSFLAGESYIVW